MENTNFTIILISSSINTNLAPIDLIIMNLIAVGIVMLTLVGTWVFARGWSLIYLLFLDGYLMIKAKLKQANNKRIHLSRTLSKNYNNLKSISRNIANPLFITTTLRSYGPGLAVGLTVGLSPLYYSLIYEVVAVMDFLTEEVPAVAAMYGNLEPGWSEQGLDVPFLEAIDGRFPEYIDGMCNMEGGEYHRTVTDFYNRGIRLESAFERLATLTQGLERYYPAHSVSIRDDLEVQAAWARARGWS